VAIVADPGHTHRGAEAFFFLLFFFSLHFLLL
jgi:hypothetical protein